MKRILALLIIVLFLITGCQNHDKKAATKAETESGGEAERSAACAVNPRTDELDFAIDPTALTFCINIKNNSISIYHGDTCKQTLLPGALRKWYIYKKTNNELRFKDTPSIGMFGLGVVKFPIDGNKCNLSLKLQEKPGCGFYLIGTDDIRNLGTVYAVWHNIHNVGTANSNYVDIGIIQNSSLYDVWIKHSKVSTNPGPPCDPDKCEDVCFAETSCP